MQDSISLQINMFGPAALPLLGLNPAVTTSLSHLLAEWEQYGFALGEPAPMESSPQALVSALQHRILSTTANTAETVNSKGILQIFMFLESRERCVSVIGENSHWARAMAVTQAVRKELLSIVSLHSAKFHQAMHSTLNKLLHNHTTQAQVHRCVERELVAEPCPTLPS